jgi:ketol-acid reductoisomerase
MDNVSNVFKRVAIFGVGLIGGSFALALKKAGAVQHIVGVGRSQASLERALQLGIIDSIATSPEAAVKDADLVLIAAPVAQTKAILDSIQPHLSPTRSSPTLAVPNLMSLMPQKKRWVQSCASLSLRIRLQVAS